MMLVNWGPSAPEAKATGQTQRWDEPQSKDLDYSESRGGEEGAKIAVGPFSSPSSRRLEMAPSTPRVGQEET